MAMHVSNQVTLFYVGGNLSVSQKHFALQILDSSSMQRSLPTYISVPPQFSTGRIQMWSPFDGLTLQELCLQKLLQLRCCFYAHLALTKSARTQQQPGTMYTKSQFIHQRRLLEDARSPSSLLLRSASANPPGRIVPPARTLPRWQKLFVSWSWK